MRAEASPQQDTAALHRPLEVVGLIVAFGLVCALARRLASAVAEGFAAGASAEERWLALAVLLTVTVGYLAADLASGVVHWLFDRFGTVDTPFFGPRFVAPFREHHETPEAITTHDFVETNGNTCLATILPLFGVSLLRLDLQHPGQLLFTALLTCTASFTLVTNQLHKWAHDPEPPPLVRWLQARRLVLSPEHHAIHHAPPHDANYCITVGWMNAPLARLRFWARAEWFAEHVLRLRVYRG